MSRALVASVVLWAAMARADAPAGRYELGDDQSTLEFRGHRSCGIERRQLARVWPRVVIEYSASKVVVNGTPWTFVGQTKDVAMARRKERWNGLTVEAWFWRTDKPSTASGGVLVVNYDANGQVVCSDSHALGGTYRP